MQKYISKAILLITITALFSGNLFSQQVIAEAGIKFRFSDSLWIRVTSQKDQSKNATLYRYKRVPIETREGKQVVPTIAVVVETIQDSLDLMMFSTMKKVKAPLDVEAVITPDKDLLQYQNAIGYRGGYTDPTGIRHTVIIIYLINKNKGVQVIMDINRELYDEYKGEFDDVIRSIEDL